MRAGHPYMNAITIDPGKLARGFVYPLFAGQKHLIAGEDFVAQVEVLCRVLMVQEAPDEWWMYGVAPGAIAESGAAPTDVSLRFATTLEAILSDFASESATFDEFRRRAERFVGEVNEPNEVDWKLAVEEFRKGTHVPEEQFEKLHRIPAETAAFVKVHLLDTRKPLSEAIERRVEPPALAAPRKKAA